MVLHASPAAKTSPLHGDCKQKHKVAQEHAGESDAFQPLVEWMLLFEAAGILGSHVSLLSYLPF